MFWREFVLWAVALGLAAFFLWPLASYWIACRREDRGLREAARRERDEGRLARLFGEGPQRHSLP